MFTKSEIIVSFLLKSKRLVVGNTVAYLLGKVISLAGHTHTKSEITNFPTSMPASDVYSWAKQSTKPSYTYSEVGAAASNHTHSGYATTTALNSLTTRVSNLEGSVDMAKLVHTEAVSYQRRTELVTTYANADYVIVCPVYDGTLVSDVPGPGIATYKVYKGCTAECVLYTHSNKSIDSWRFTFTYGTDGTIKTDGYDKGNTTTYPITLEFYKQ